MATVEAFQLCWEHFNNRMLEYAIYFHVASICSGSGEHVVLLACWQDARRLEGVRNASRKGSSRLETSPGMTFLSLGLFLFFFLTKLALKVNILLFCVNDSW